MKLTPIVGALIVMIFWSCVHQSPKNKNANTQQVKLKSGLKIENRPNRGTFYNDSLGAKYGITYIPVTIKNDSTIPLHIQMNFSNAYNFPQPDSDEMFELTPLPEEWALDGTEITDGMLDGLQHFLDKPRLNKIIEPGEKLVLAIGTHRSVPSKTSVPIPNALFIQNNKDLYHECDSLIYQNNLTISTSSLWLKLVVDINSDSPWCTLIPCGQISYSEN